MVPNAAPVCCTIGNGVFCTEKKRSWSASGLQAGSTAPSLLLAACTGFFLALAGYHLPEHDDPIAVHEGHTGEPLAVLERVAHQRLLGLEAALGHLVRLQRVRVLHLFPARFLAHLPLELRDAAP